MKSLVSKNIRNKLEKQGWEWHEFHIAKPIGKYEMTIEFCIGDCCLGIYENQQLLEEKQRCDSFIEAWARSTLLEEKYKL